MNTRTSLRTLYGLVAWLHVIVGAALAIQGPALPHIRATFGLSLFAVSWLFPAMSLGHLLGVLGSGVSSVTHRRRLMTVFGTAMLTIGFAVLGGAPYWGVALAGGLVLGLGFGCLDVVLNAAVGGRHPAATEKRRVSSTCYTRSSRWARCSDRSCGRGGWNMVPRGGRHSCSVPCCWHQACSQRLTAWYPAAPPQRAARPPTWRLLLADASLRWLALMMLLYVGVEVGIAAWLTTYMIELHGATAAAGARATAAFWAALLVGRLAAAGLTGRWSVRRVLLTSMSAAVVAIVVAIATTSSGVATACICARRVLHRRQSSPPLWPWRKRGCRLQSGPTTALMMGSASVGWLVSTIADGDSRGALGCRCHDGRRSRDGRRDAGDGFSRSCAVVYRRQAPLFEVVAETPAAAGVAQLAERLGFNLANALARHLESLADLFQRAIVPVVEAIPQTQHLPLARGERVEHTFYLILKGTARGLIGRHYSRLIGDEVAERVAVLFPDRCFQGDRLLGNVENLLYLLRAPCPEREPIPRG